MKKQSIFIVKTILVVIIIFLFTGITGCQPESINEEETKPENIPDATISMGMDFMNSVAYPDVISDEAGGAIIIYCEAISDQSQVIHVKRIDQSGESMWDQILGIGYGFAGNYLKLINDGNSGVITYAYVSPVDDVSPQVNTIFRIDSQGDIVWETGLPVNRTIEEMASDGAGGAIFCYRDSRQQNNCYMQRINSQGHLLWGKDELILRRDNYHFGSSRLVSDGSEGAIITWHERRNERDSRICGQRVNSDGSFIWEGQNLIKKGKVLYTADQYLDGQKSQMIRNDSGEVLLTWIERNQVPPEFFDVTVIQINSAGVLEWEAHTELDPDVSIVDYLSFPGIIRNGTEIILFWSDVNTIFAQKLGASGKSLWPDNGIVVWRDQDSSRVASQGTEDNSDGAFLTWSYLDNDTIPQDIKIGVQKISSGGTTQWTIEDISMISGNETFSRLAGLISDGEGGVLIVWTSGTEMRVFKDSYIQKINGEGTPVWNKGGIKLGQ